MAKITNSNIPFTSKITMITRDGIHKINGKNVTLSVLPSDSSKCHSFVSIWADAADAIKVNPWHPTDQAKSFFPTRYLNLYVKTKDQADEIENTFNHAKNVGNRNFEITHDEEKGLLDIKESYIKELV